MKMGKQGLAPDGSMFYSTPDHPSQDSISAHADDDYEWMLSDLITRIDIIDRPSVTHKSLPYYRFLAYRQVTAMILESCDAFVQGDVVSISIDQDRLLKKFTSGMKSRKKNLATRYASQKATSDDFFPTGYSPDTCAINEEVVDTLATLQEFIAWERELPFGYFLVATNEAIASVVERLSLIMADLRVELTGLEAYIAEQLDDESMADVGEVAVGMMTKPIFRSIESNTTAPLSKPRTENEAGKMAALLALLDDDDEYEMELPAAEVPSGYCLRDLESEAYLTRKYPDDIIHAVMSSMATAYGISIDDELTERMLQRLDAIGTDPKKDVLTKVDRLCRGERDYRARE